MGDDGRIDLEEARLVVMDVMDGPYKMQGRGVMSSVTDVEIATLEYAGELFEWTDEARAWVFGDLLDKMVRGVAGEDDVRGVSYYQVIGGVRYDVPQGSGRLLLAPVRAPGSSTSRRRVLLVMDGDGRAVQDARPRR